jgi:hypothetical protein
MVISESLVIANFDCKCADACLLPYIEGGVLLSGMTFRRFL